MSNLDQVTKEGNLEKVTEILKTKNILTDSLDVGLYIASKYGHLSIVKLYTEYGADPNWSDNEYNTTSLIEAVKNGYIYIVEQLIKNKNLNINHECYVSNDYTATDFAINQWTYSKKSIYMRIYNMLTNAGGRRNYKYRNIPIPYDYPPLPESDDE